MNLQTLLHSIFISFFICLSAQAVEIADGSSIEEATKAMKQAGYSTTVLSMASREQDSRLAFWNIGEGVLIVVYNLQTKKINGISYWFSDERPKGSRKTFDLNVENFDTETGKIVIQTKKPKR